MSSRKSSRKSSRNWSDPVGDVENLHQELMRSNPRMNPRVNPGVNPPVLEDFVTLLRKVGEILGEKPNVDVGCSGGVLLALKAFFGERCMIEADVSIKTGLVSRSSIWWNENNDETKNWKMSRNECRLENNRSRSSIDAKNYKAGQAVLQLKKAFLALDPTREDFRNATDALLREAISAGIPGDINPNWNVRNIMKRTVMPSELVELLKSIQHPDTEQVEWNFAVGATVVETGIFLAFAIDDPSICVMLERRFIGDDKEPVLSVYIEE